MSIVEQIPFSRRLELNRTRGYKYARGTVRVSEDAFDDYFEFYCQGLDDVQRAQMTKMFWEGVDAGKATLRR